MADDAPSPALPWRSTGSKFPIGDGERCPTASNPVWEVVQQGSLTMMVEAFTMMVEAINLWLTGSNNFCFEKDRKWDEEENKRGRDRERRLRAANLKSLFFFEILPDLKKQAVPNHLADESQTRTHHRTILKRVWSMMHLHPRCLDRPLGPSFRSKMEKDVQQ